MSRPTGLCLAFACFTCFVKNVARLSLFSSSILILSLFLIFPRPAFAECTGFNGMETCKWREYRVKGFTPQYRVCHSTTNYNEKPRKTKKWCDGWHNKF